ncbi:MAG: response regulator [Pirellulaceae bacterium]
MDPNATVHVVDDHELARNSVCALVESMGVAATVYASAEEFLESYHPGRPGCLVTDVRMLGMSGIELQERLAASKIDLPVVVITAHANTPLTVRAMRNGAVTLLEKPCNDNDLWDAIREALDQDERQRAAAHRRRQIRDRLDSLTQQEREVLDRMVAGKLNKVIARELDVSIRTIENRRHNIFRKFGAESVAELVRLVMESEADPD